MKRFYKLLLVCLCAVSLFFTACDRELESDIISRTPPALQVNVTDAANKPFPSATVRLYRDEAAWTSEGTANATRQTGANGSLQFTQEELANPGFFYLITTSGSLKVKSKTPYLLLNDGVTYFNVVLK